jgi:hypothetical protein
MPAHTTRSLLGGNHREINERQQNFEFGRTKIACNCRLGASKSGTESTAEPEEVMMIEETWMQPYLAFKVNKLLPEDAIEARRIIRRSKAFVVLQGKLYKKSITGVLQ